MEQKIKQDIQIGINIRKIRKKRQLGQTDLVRLLQIEGCDMTRECLVKIERCVQHIQASQLQAIKKALDTTYDVLIDGSEEETQ
ncbi:helix-turn-helix domain-containing protein [Mediterraneibacter gnavus]|uniref:helix-turn-helix domain-containing protein n=1 Tax=Mediterraneibacter gnavus TaxID=33038 RepID=UPI00232DA80A|nr:transcriptional regulator [Mediterraneibacter gnavus]MDB8709725.1 transcriptional regulator [Mediterraneibacter gnavus]MDB8712491.1 transcriptional regulator [Mediterraneibacter gnavus]